MQRSTPDSQRNHVSISFVRPVRMNFVHGKIGLRDFGQRGGCDVEERDPRQR